MRHDQNRPRRTAVILDPQPLCHTAMRSILAPLNIELVGTATTTDTVETLLTEHRPDLYVAELDLDGAYDEALLSIEMARTDQPNLTVIVLSAADDPALIDAAFDRGAAAYVLKTSTTDTIATAIAQAFEPSVFLSPPDSYRRAAATRDATALRKLTRRETEILQLVSGGRSNRQVAEILYVTDQTVKFHLANIYRKLGVRSRYDAARWARHHGLVDTPVGTNVVALAQASRAAAKRQSARARVEQPRTATEGGETSR